MPAAGRPPRWRVGLDLEVEPWESDEAMRKAERLLGEVRGVLLREWDPIGVGRNRECRGEYDRYARTVCRYLAEGADESKLTAYLGQVRTDIMGLSTVDPECDRAVARRLFSLST
jgi:hypothetical protein